MGRSSSDVRTAGGWIEHSVHVHVVPIWGAESSSSQAIRLCLGACATACSTDATHASPAGHARLPPQFGMCVLQCSVNVLHTKVGQPIDVQHGWSPGLGTGGTQVLPGSSPASSTYPTPHHTAQKAAAGELQAGACLHSVLHHSTLKSSEMHGAACAA